METHNYTPEDFVKLAAAAALDKKATRPVILDLRHQGAFTEFFLVVSAANARQASAIANGIRVFFKETFGLRPVSSDGFEGLTWVLLDYGSFFIHVFQEPTRELYQIEQLWNKARIVPLSEDAVTKLYSSLRPTAQAEA